MPLPVAASISSCSPLGERALDARDDLCLARAQRREGEADRVGRDAPRRAQLRGAREVPETAIEGARDLGVELSGRELDALAQGHFPADPDELRASGSASRAAEHARVERRLEPPGREPGLAPRRERLQLLDEPARLPRRRTPSARPRSEIRTEPCANVSLERDLGLERRVGSARVRLVRGVKGLSERRGESGATAHESGPRRGRESEVAHPDLECLREGVEARGADPS